MKITSSYISLTELTFNDLELIRKWRNTIGIRQHMDFQEEITPEMQEKWFEKLDPSVNFFFIIHFNKIPIGLIQLQEIDWNSKTASSGLYIGDQRYQGSPLAYMASLPILDLGFNILGLESIIAKVSKQNKKALQYNQSLGFIIEKELNERFVLMSHSKEQFKTAIEKHKSFHKFFKSYSLTDKNRNIDFSIHKSWFFLP